MFCPNCGFESNGKFCTNCGTKMPTVEEPASEETEELIRQAEAAAAEATAVVSAPPAEEPAPADTPVFAPVQSDPEENSADLPAPDQPVLDPEGVPEQRNEPEPAEVVTFHGIRSEPICKTPASQLVRRLATSGAWILAAVVSTLAFLISVYLNVFDTNTRNIHYYLENLSRFRGTDYEPAIIGSIAAIAGALLASAVFVLLLWVIFGSAAGKDDRRMGTGALTFFKVVAIIALVLICILLAVSVLFCGLSLLFGARGNLIDEMIVTFDQNLQEYQIPLPELRVSVAVAGGILFGVLSVVLLFCLIYAVKVIKSLNTAKRVIRTGNPDDRVSPFVAVLTMICAVFILIAGVSLIALGGTANILSGVALLLSAVADFCFAVVIFRFRSGMRQLGAYRGVVRQPVQ